MPVLKITVNCERDPWDDLLPLREQGKLITAMGTESGAIRVGGLPHGMDSGKTSISIVIPLPDGTMILTETSLALFLAAARALEGAYPNG